MHYGWALDVLAASARSQLRSDTLRLTGDARSLSLAWCGTVQGFETVRYLADEYNAEPRPWATRLAQGIAATFSAAIADTAAAERNLRRLSG